jgi:hypothetical protein
LLCGEGAQPNTLCVVAESTEAEQTESSGFLQKVFAAAKQEWMCDVAVLPLPADRFGKVRFADVRVLGDFRRVFVFGVPIGHLGLRLRLPPYRPVQWQGAALMLADAPLAIMADKSLKVKLWEPIQQLYGLSRPS